MLFKFTGTLTGNIDVLWPSGKTKLFIVYNGASGAFSLSCGVDNGSGSPAGVVVVVPQGTALILQSDGTDVSLAVTRVGLGAAASGANSDITSLSGLTTPLSLAQGGTAATSASAARTSLGLGSSAVVNQTVSTSTPSGTPGNGDIWLQYVP